MGKYLAEQMMVKGKIASVKPFPRRPVLLPGEAWVSLRRRGIRKMFYENLQLYDAYPRKLLQSTREDLDHPVNAETYTVLGILNNVEPEDIYCSTIHVFSRVFMPNSVKTRQVSLSTTTGTEPLPLLANYSRFVTPYNNVKFCPKCLAKHRYFRLLWLPIATCVCLQHSCLLIQKCPSCASSLKIDNIIDGLCSNCSFELSNAPVIKLRDKVCLQSQKVIQSLLIDQPIVTFAYKLPFTDTVPLFRLIEGIKSSIENDIQDNNFIYQPVEMSSSPQTDVSRTLYVYSTAFRAVSRWPQSFYEFLSRFIKRDGRHLSYEIREDFSYLANSCLENAWRGTEFSPVQEAYENFLVEKYPACHSVLLLKRYKDNPSFAHRIPYLSSRQVANLLNVDLEMVYKLLADGSLRKYPSPALEDGIQDRILIYKEDAIKLTKDWADAITIQELSKKLGLSGALIDKLVKAGHLRAIRQPSTNEVLEWRFSIHDVNQFIKEIENLVQRIDISSNSYVNILSAVHHVKPYIRITDLIQWILDGLLIPYVFNSESYLLSEIYFRLEDVRKCISVTIASSELLSVTDVASIFRIPAAAMYELCKMENIGILRGSKRYLYANELEQLRQKYVNKFDAAQILHVSCSTVKRWEKHGRIKILKEADKHSPKIELFDRASLQSWIDENIGFGEACEVLGVPEHKLIYWIEKKWIAVTDAAPKLSTYYSRADVMKMKNVQPI